jgi:hypothetical protein
MIRSSGAIARRATDSIKRWFHSRLQECRRCSQCEGEITPWASYCPTCGQANPAKVSASAGVYLTLGIVSLALVLTVLFNIL